MWTEDHGEERRSLAESLLRCFDGKRGIRESRKPTYSQKVLGTKVVTPLSVEKVVFI